MNNEIDLLTNPWHEVNRKRPLHVEWYQKSFYKDYSKEFALNPIGPGYSTYRDNYDVRKKANYNRYQELINKLANQSYGIVLDNDKLYVRKVIGGIMVNETKAKVIRKIVNLNKIRKFTLDEQLNYINNLFM